MTKKISKSTHATLFFCVCHLEFLSNVAALTIFSFCVCTQCKGENIFFTKETYPFTIVHSFCVCLQCKGKNKFIYKGSIPLHYCKGPLVNSTWLFVIKAFLIFVQKREVKLTSGAALPVFSSTKNVGWHSIFFIWDNAEKLL